MKENATARVKVKPSTLIKLKVRAAKKDKTAGEYIEYLLTLKTTTLG